jgi:hypothetical protein
VIVRHDDAVSVLYGRCAHRGALMADGHIQGDNLICGVHGWDYRFDTGISEYNNSEALPTYTAWVENGHVLVDEDEIAAWAVKHPQPYNRNSYQGAYQDPHGTVDEPHVALIRQLADEGLSTLGHHGPAASNNKVGADWLVVQEWDLVQLSHDELQVVLFRQRIPRHPVQPDRCI